MTFSKIGNISLRFQMSHYLWCMMRRIFLPVSSRCGARFIILLNRSLVVLSLLHDCVLRSGSRFSLTICDGIGARSLIAWGTLQRSFADRLVLARNLWHERSGCHVMC